MTSSTNPAVTLSVRQTRAATVLTYVAFATGTFLPMAVDLSSRSGGSTAAALRALGVIGCIALFLLSRHSRQVHAAARDIDERERADRAASYELSFQILVTVCFLLLLFVLAMHALHRSLEVYAALADLLMFISVGGFALPATVLAWRDPGGERSDEADA